MNIFLLYRMKTQLLKIEEIANKKAKEIEKAYFEKYNNFYRYALKIIGDFKILLYGGTAINEILPDKLKFYSKTELPDIDILCTYETYKELSKKLLKSFFLKGFHLTTIREALHENTYKLMVEGLHIIDITLIDESLFNNLSKNKLKTSFPKIYTVNIEYLKFSLHTLIAQPLQSYKWTKVFDRMISLYKAYPNNASCSIDIENYFIKDVPDSIINDMIEYLKTTEYAFFGWDILSKYLKCTIKKQNPIRYILSTNSHSTVSYEIVSYIKHKDITSIDKNKYSMVCYKNIPIVYIYNTHNCASYITIRGQRQLSIHSIIQQFYMIYFITNDKEILCIIHNLVEVLMKNISSTKKLYKQFVVDCYGEQKGIVTLRKEKFKREKEKLKLIS
jgi:hypothetical protein